MTTKMLPQLYFDGLGRVEIGKDAIGGSYIPANMKIKIYYKNNNGEAKKFRFIIEYKH
jgi:hypothetical protein